MEADILKIVGNFLIIAIFFETALSIIFNWRLFILHCDSKGWKTPINIGLALVFSFAFGLDIFSKVIEIMGQGSPSPILGKIFTALLLAGGSASIHELLRKIGARGKIDPKKSKEIDALKILNQLKKERKSIEDDLPTASEDYTAEFLETGAHLVFNRQQNRLTGLEGSWNAVSGAGSTPSIAKGIYNCPKRSLMVGTEDDPIVPLDNIYAGNSYIDKNSFGWFFYLGKDNLGIHPDGGVTGTAGCIGVTTDDTRPLFNALKEKYNDELIVVVV